ncbi:hypothetical protein U1Q18_008011, partial [Sarracenia purpurea var. burkii]
QQSLNVIRLVALLISQRQSEVEESQGSESPREALILLRNRGGGEGPSGSASQRKEVDPSQPVEGEVPVAFLAQLEAPTM